MKEVAKKLKMKSPDSAAGWCIENAVTIMTIGKKRVVSEFDFRVAIERPLILELKQKYGNKWPDYYELHKSGDVKKFYELEMNGNTAAQKPNSFDAEPFFKEIGLF